MSAKAIVTTRLAELREELKDATEKRAAIVDAAIAEKRGMTTKETGKFDAATAQRSALLADITVVEERLADLVAQETASAAADAARAATGAPVGGAKVAEKPIYRADNTLEQSYFRDLYKASRNDPDAQDRLRRNSAIEAEKRADTVGTVTGSGIPSGNAGVFAPPTWLVDQYVKFARPGRVGVDTFDKMSLPGGTSSISIPKVTGGTATGLQTAGELSALVETDITTSSISSGITTIGGKQLISLQLLEQSAIPFDRVILEDLALAYAANIDLEGLTGSGSSGHLRGILSAAGIVNQVYTDASPAFAGAGKMYNQILKASATIHANRFLAADSILMHPTRWSWITGQYDTTNRPMIVPQGVNALNAVAEGVDINSAQGSVGRLGQLDVFIDPQIPTNLAGGTQDTMVVYLRNDIKLWETGPRFESFQATYADTAGVLFRALGYAAMIPDRYGSSIVQITGTGMAFPPSF